jgi:uncharacterized membrane protein
LNFELAPALALCSAALYGAADFLGGLGARRTNTIAVVAVSQLVGLMLLAVMLVWLPDAAPRNRDLFWGGAAGLAGGIGVVLLYRALAVGKMAVVAPTTAVCAVAIPVTAAMLLGERPSAGRLVGMGLAIVAIVLVSHTRYGPLSTVVTLSSLYPASTVILARVILGERLSTCRAWASRARWSRWCCS